MLPSCSAVDQLATGEERAQRSRRNGRIALTAAVVVSIALPGAMFAAGKGEMVATTLVVLGALVLAGAGSARRMYARGDPATARGTYIAMGFGLLLMVASCGAAALASALAHE